ncbi:MAG: chondroitinase-B domain-containing protein [Bdellovibrionales bacterium]
MKWKIKVSLVLIGGAITALGQGCDGFAPAGIEGRISSSLGPHIDPEPEFTDTPGEGEEFPEPPNRAASTCSGTVVNVSTVGEMTAALAAAQPGHVITLAPGTYTINSSIGVSANGTASQPICLRAETFGTVTLRSNTMEMFKIAGAHWTFENLAVQGICGSDALCEHAFHVVQGAHFWTLRNSVMRDFNAMIKVNGQAGTYPSDVLIESNQFYNTRGRNVGVLTFIDVVGGDRYIIRGNYIADFHKDGGNYVSYGAFLKGNGTNGLFENNLVVCSKNLPHNGDARIGLSFGGGGTGEQYCQDGGCATEHRNGTLRNNIIMNCSDVGVYLNKSQNTQIYNNTILNTAGIDARFSTTTASVRNNIIQSKDGSAIANRDGGTHTASNNLIRTSGAAVSDIFVNPGAGNLEFTSGAGALLSPGVTIPGYSKDFCGDSYTGAPNLGAIKYAASSSCPVTVKQLYDSL